ncbi:selenocysteine-specific translation elongation factor, partial [Jatrophihabitans sp. YIM 134969]
MAVVATAGHVDHGKSTLVRALTGIEPDRWAEERRRGMTLDLGFAWTTLPSGVELAFVDVPGHERFVPTMLAGVGPVPAVVLVVAADEGWKPQSAEHLEALDALGVSHGLLVVTRSDLADPAAATRQAAEALEGTSLAGIPALAVSAATGAGMDVLPRALDDLVGRLPRPLLDAPVRFWVDRAFSIRGAGTVVTGTLGAGTVRVGDEFEIAPGGGRVTVRGVQTAGRDLAEAVPVSRVALNLRGVSPGDVARGHALLTPGAWASSAVVDVRLDGPPPREATLHVGSAAVPARIRPLGEDLVRVTTTHPLPWHVGDRALLRDPGAHTVAGGLTVLDPSPPALRRRGAARD